MAMNSVPRSPNASTSGVTITGPSATPTFPPRLNMLMPLARLAPDT